MITTQSRAGTTNLAALVVAFGVGLSVVGCSTHPTTLTGASTTGTISTTAPSDALVDVEKVWATHPMPPCPDVLIGNRVAPFGVSLPDDTSVARELEDVRSPGSSVWVTRKLGWVTKALGETRAGIIDTVGTPGAQALTKGFDDYVAHVREELQAGQDIPSYLDDTFVERCMS